MKILNVEMPTPAQHTDDAIAVLIVVAYVAGKALASQGYGFDIPDDILMLVLCYALKGGLTAAIKK